MPDERKTLTDDEILTSGEERSRWSVADADSDDADSDTDDADADADSVDPS